MSIDPHALEAAMPTLISKLQELQRQLTPAEQGVFKEVIRSAALHTSSTLQAQALGERYAKPISASATLSMKRQLVDLPYTLNIQTSMDSSNLHT